MQPKKGTLRLHWRILLFSILGLSLLSCDDAESRRQLVTLRQMAAEIPLFANFKEVYSYDANKPNKALFGLCYESSASYDEVKDYYAKTLTAKGWSRPEEETVYGSFGLEQKKGSRKLIFRKAEYQISITYGPKDYSGCNYAISYSWEK